jgi:hypothetical protein
LYHLEELLRDRILRKDNDTWKDLTSENGPFYSFYQKLVFGYAMRLFNADFYGAMNLIRIIRNQFAHAKRKTDFGNDLILDELRKIKFKRRRVTHYLKMEDKNEAGRLAYAAVCFHLSAALVQTGNRSFLKKQKRVRAKTAASPLAQALARSLGIDNALLAPQEFGQLALLGQKTGDPNPGQEQPTALGLLNFLDKTGL